MEKFDNSYAARELRDACVSGNKAMVMELLQQGADPSFKEARDFRGMTPLHYACQHGWLDVVELLVEEYKCDPEVRTYTQNLSHDRMDLLWYCQVTPLHLACEYGMVTLAKLLIEKYQCNPNVTSTSKFTPLHFACEGGKVEVTKLLIESYKCNLNIQDTFERTPLNLACQNGHIEVVLLLVNVNECELNTVDKIGRTPLHHACGCKYIDIAKSLITHGADPNVADSGGNTPLHNACSTGQLDFVKCLLMATKCNPNIQNEYGFTPLYLNVSSVGCFDPKIIKELSIAHTVSANPNISDVDGNTPLHIACQTGHVDSVKCLLTVSKCNPNIKNKAGLTPLQVTSPKHSRVMKEFITRGANPNVADSDGNTPLHNACQAGQLDSVKYLLAVEKCDTNAKNKDGLTPLQITSINHSHIIRELTLHGANPNVADSDGNTPLHIACYYRQLQSVYCLLTVAKCDPNAKNKDGLTPLQVDLNSKSFWHTDSDIKLVLIAHGADPNVADSDGNPSLHKACKARELDSVKWLLSVAKCNPNVKNKAGLTPLHVNLNFSWYTQSDSDNDIMKEFRENPNLDHDIMRELLTHGADPNVADSDGNTSLHKVCEAGIPYFVKCFLAVSQCNPNIKNKAGLTPLLVTSPKHSHIIEEIITHGANPNVADSDGNTPLHKACEAGILHSVKCLLAVSQCDPNIKNKAGLTPLQVTSPKHSHIIEEIITHGANPNVADSDGNTPLHNACQAGQLDSVKYLLAVEKCDTNAKNKDGLTPLQITSIKYSHIIKELTLHGANPNVADSDGNTPLHNACYYGRLDSVKCLLTVAKCDPNAKNKDGLTPLQVDLNSKSLWHTDSDITMELIVNGADPNVAGSDGNTPLHNACYYRQLDSVKWLLSVAKCNPNVKNKAGLNPLHVNLNFSWYTQSDSDNDIMKEFITHGENPNLDHDIMRELLAHGADPNVADSDGNTPLHKACEVGILHSVKCLLAVSQCDPNIKNKAGLTPLQVTSPKHSHIIEVIITHGANPNVADSDGNTPLHNACQAGQSDSVKYLLAVEKCDTNAKNKDGLTPLQVISPHHSLLMNQLIAHGANANVTDSDGNTPLHIACQEYDFDAVKHLLAAADCDPNAKNKDGLTPLQVTSLNSTTIIRELIRHGANANDVYKNHGKALKQPLNPPVKVFVVGNPSVGKSTLTAALQKESSFFGRRFKTNQKVTGVDTKTAGVVPHEFESKEYGYATFYDFAGQREFYGSHAALLQNAIQSSPPIFLLVVDLRESEQQIKQIVLYWLTFLECQCALVSNKPHVIFVGSHADVLKKRGEDPKLKSSCLNPDTAIPFSKFVFAGLITMDCQYPESRGMNELRQCLKGSCNALRTRETITFNSHCFYVYLVDKFKNSIAVTVEQIQAQIKAEESPDSSKHDVTSFVPDNLLRLCKICDELNDRGHILFLKDLQDIEQSWVVIDKKYLLAQFSGSIFAPEGFKQHTVITQCTCSTGVVPLSSVAKSFPEHNPELLTKFLSCLEFCHEISDSEILHRITAEHQTCIVNGPSSLGPKERYFLFPALVSLNVPANIWDDKPQFECHFGWILCCTNERTEQFFTSRFLQVLLLRIGFSFPLSEGHTHHSHPAIRRNCSIWKNGIFWGNDCGVETLVEVIPDNKAVIVLMRCGETAIIDMVQLRSQVIRQVLKAAEEFCSSITTVESFIDPSQCKQYPLKPPSQLKLFSILNTSRAVLDARPSATVVIPTGTVLLENLIQCEPYAELGEDILGELFENQDQDTEVILDSFLSQIAEAKTKNFNLFIKMLIPEHEAHNTATTQDIVSVLKTWRAGCAGTYKILREKLDEFSVFAGRNPLTLAGRQRRSKPKDSLAALLKPPSRRDEVSSSIEEIPVKSDKPTLKLLQALKYGEKRVKVIENVAAEWEQLAIALGFDLPVINYLRRDFSHDAMGAATQVLIKWLSGEGDLDQPITWDTLIQCLNDAGQVSLAEDLADLLKDGLVT